MLTPTLASPLACLDLNSVTTLMAFRPAFSANVLGMTSRASANALKHMLSGYERVSASRESVFDMYVSGAPPPVPKL